MTRYAIGKGVFSLDSDGNTLSVYRTYGQKIYYRTVGEVLGTETPFCYGDEALTLADGKILKRNKSRLEII